MESDRTTRTPSDGVRDGPMRPLHGRTSGPTRRSTKGQWTAEEDEVLRDAVQRFKGKNWKRIAECFKDRTDVQCLHRWQKVLNPELVKGPWSKEEDEIIIELVKKHGPKKWSTIAQHLPGRIGKQCRERWHNHLNPNINKEAWTQEEELALIRAHQIYGNKWAELSKFLPGRSDNAIKNHWNSSVKKKLQSYLASGLLPQFQGLPHVGHPNQSMPSSSSTLQQSSEDDSVPKDGTDAEDISECSQGSFVFGCSQSTNHLPNAVAHTREDYRLIEAASHGKDSCFSPASCSENPQTAFQEVSFSMPEVPDELGGSSNFLEHNYYHGWGSYAGKDWQLNSNALCSLSSLDMGQESENFLMHCIDENENHEMAPFPLENSEDVNGSPSLGNVIFGSDKPEHMLASDDGCSRVMYTVTENDWCFAYGNVTNCPNLIGYDGSTESLLYQPSDMLGTSRGQPLAVPSQVPPHDGKLYRNLSDEKQEEISKGPNDGFIRTSDYASSPCDDGTDCMGLQDESDHAQHSLKLVPVDAFSSEPANDIPVCSPIDEKPIVPIEPQETGALFYEPPRFPSLDIPFFSCDLIQSGNDVQQEYSPLGIRQLMMSSMNCFSPFRLWDSPSRDDSPDAVLRSAAKTFTCTPSILKKRNRDMVSPMSEKRSEKKLERDMNQESYSSLAKDFSRLYMFSESGNKKEPLVSPSSNQKEKSENLACDKENVDHAQEAGKEHNGGNGVQHKKSEKEHDDSNFQDMIKQGPVIVVSKAKGDKDAAAEKVQQSSGVLVEQNVNDLLLSSPDQLESKSDRTLGPSNGSHQCSRRLETKLTQSALSESLSGNPCSSIVRSPTVFGKKDKSPLAAARSTQFDLAVNPMENMVGSSGNDAGVENLSIFGETPFRRSIESPSAWKSPWFINSFLLAPRGDADVGYLISPGDRSYDAIGLMKQLSAHTAAAFADAQEVLGDETPETILNERSSYSQKLDQDNCVVRSQPANHSPSASNIMTERRVLDFSECGTPRAEKGKERGKFSTATSFSSPSSYLLKGCR